MNEALRKYGAKDCITGEIVATQWEPNTIQKYLEMFKPNTANVMFLTQSTSELCKKLEPYFQTLYNAESKSVFHIFKKLIKEAKSHTYISFLQLFIRNSGRIYHTVVKCGTISRVSLL